MEQMMNLTLQALYCLVGISAFGMFLSLIIISIRQEQRAAELDRRREEREMELYRSRMETMKK